MADSPYVTNPNDPNQAVSGAPTANYGSNYLATAPAVDYGSLWNTAWNQGYNNYGNSTNPYSGQSGSGYDIGAAYTQGQQAYQANMPTSPPPSGGTPTGGTPTQQTSGTYNFNMGDFPNYTGWDPTAAQQDWIAKGRPSPGGSSGGGSDPYTEALNASKNAVNSAYDPIFSQLDQMAGLIPAQQAQREQSIGNLYGTQQNELGTSMQGSLSALDPAKQQVASNQAQGIRDLQQNMQQMMKAGNMQLGTTGAGNSSASKMLAFALSKAAGQGSANITNQSQQQYGQIEAQAQQIRSTYDDQVAKLGTWKADNLNQVVSWAQDQLGQVQSAKLNATGQKAAALAATEQSIVNNALSALQTIQNNVTNWQTGMQSWAAQRMATLDDAKLAMSKNSTYNSAAIMAPELAQFTSNQSTASPTYAGSNPWSTQKKDASSFLSNLTQ